MKELFDQPKKWHLKVAPPKKSTEIVVNSEQILLMIYIRGNTLKKLDNKVILTEISIGIIIIKLRF